MAITKEKKAQILSSLGAGFAEADSIAFAAFDRLSVADVTKLRRSLAEAGVSYQVVKKTLLSRALSGIAITGEAPELNGNIAVAWSATDAVAPAREIHKFSTAEKGRDEQIRLLGGVFESKYMTASEIKEIATIPSLHVLRGMFVNVINSPIQGFVIALSKIAENKE